MNPVQQQNGTPAVVQGRIVWGGVKKSIKRVYGSQQPMIDPKTNKEIEEWAFGLAVPKPSPQSKPHEVENFNKLWTALHNEANKQGVQYPNPKFAFKFIDGDSTKQDGSPYPEHSRGCIVVACSTRIPLKLNSWIHGSDLKQVTDNDIKCGDYVQVALDIQGHPAPNAGLYVNPSFVALIGYGEAIINTVDPKTILGARPEMPMGGSLTPIGTAPQMPGQFAAPQQFAPPAFTQNPTLAPQGFQQPMNAPAPQFTPNMNVLPPQFQQHMAPQGFQPPMQGLPPTQQQMGNAGVQQFAQPASAGFAQPMQPQQGATSAPQPNFGIPTFPSTNQ